MAELHEAYKMVYDDIMNRGSGMFQGVHDAKHGNENFMFGIYTVMEFISYNAGTFNEFSDIFHDNFQKSVDKAKEL